MSPRGAVIEVLVTPGSSRPGIRGRMGRAYKVAVAAQPERGRANAELLERLAAVLNVPVSALTLAGGAGTRRKRVRIAGVTREEADRALSRA